MRYLREHPVSVTLRADGGPPQRRWASGVIAGNVGSLQGNVRLLPDADLRLLVPVPFLLAGGLGLLGIVLSSRRRRRRGDDWSW